MKASFVSRPKRAGFLCAASTVAFCLLASILSSHAVAAAQTSSAPTSQPPAQDYLVYVVCESADKIVLVRFGPGGARIESEARIGLMPTDINGPHGVAVSPDKQFVYVAQGHGRPEGSLWKFHTGSNTAIKYTSLGMFPATTDISADGNSVYVAN
ncbi:MAG TPA: beta-propeller fold lactonase family protein, partial [Candidatus Binatia bacterium]|nr:beta-propeller fold lactonase family protein [Candidatus Binatia bacterium]